MLSFEEAMKEFLLHCMYEKDLSKNTIKFYKIDLVQFRAFLELQRIPLQINTIDKVHLKAYVREL
jgi:site-specific recombinase XerD